MRHWRFHFVVLFLFCFFAILVGRLAYLQIVNQGLYKALAQGQQNVSIPSRGERGAVFLQDKNGNLYTAATNQKIPSAFVSPAELKNPEDAARKLAQILQLEEEFILSKIQNKDSFFEILKRRISETEAQQIQDLKLAGVGIRQEQVRAYPQISLAAHVIGFTNQDGKGQYGVEGYYDNKLAGKEGVGVAAKNPASYLLAVFASTNRNGEDVVLTLDYNIQSVAEQLLEKARINLNIEEGTIIAMDPTSGKIIALANTPSFDPNTYSSVKDLEVFQNPAIQKIYEPGSIFKAITMAAALNEGVITPNTTYTDKGFVQIGGRKIKNYDQRVWNLRTMTETLEYSINTGAVFAEQQLGQKKFLDYITKFGFFDPTNIDLAGEVFSRNTEFKKGYEINFATASFGQGIEMTPLQVVQAFSALANNGVMMKPTIVQKPETESKQTKILSPQTSTQITEMLTNVVQNGYAKSAQIPGYHIAGKTGTAQISWSALGVAKSGYSNKTVQSFVGYAPAFDPKFLILVKLDNPTTKTAEYSAVPIFRELAKYIIDYYQIPPDY